VQNFIPAFQHALEKRSGQTCTIMMKRLRDTSGTYRLVSMVGFERLGRAIGELGFKEKASGSKSSNRKLQRHV
jgi:hypothetical protein